MPKCFEILSLDEYCTYSDRLRASWAQNVENLGIQPPRLNVYYLTSTHDFKHGYRAVARLLSSFTHEPCVRRAARFSLNRYCRISSGSSRHMEDEHILATRVSPGEFCLKYAPELHFGDDLITENLSFFNIGGHELLVHKVP